MRFLPFLLLCLCCACCRGGEFPWSDDPPPALIQEAVLPDRVLDEQLVDWRPVLAPIVRPLVASCSSAREAVLTVAARLPQTTGVHYSLERRKPDMNALESLQEKKVSCTGQSILLVCALRSIGIPARAAGVVSWGHIPGNHTWVEAWVDGEWQMIEFGESAFNTPWVMENIGMLNPAIPEQRVYAVVEKDTGLYFPVVWDSPLRLPAVDVTERYQALSRQWYESQGLPPHTQRLMLDVKPRSPQQLYVYLEDEAGTRVAQAPLPTPTDDVRKMATLHLPRDGRTYYLSCDLASGRHPLTATPAPVQLLLFQAPSPKAPTEANPGATPPAAASEQK